ncbi:hypothetical protein LguiB_016337 [Lonicera macranthoides]
MFKSNPKKLNHLFRSSSSLPWLSPSHAPATPSHHHRQTPAVAVSSGSIGTDQTNPFKVVRFGPVLEVYSVQSGPKNFRTEEIGPVRKHSERSGCLLRVRVCERKTRLQKAVNRCYTFGQLTSQQSNFMNLQRTFARYTDRTAFERPLTSGVAYAVRVLHSEREQFEKQQGWTIERMDTLEQTPPVHKDGYNPVEPSPIQEEYAPVIFAQDTIAHVVSLDMLSGKEDRENMLRAKASGKGVLTAPFRLIKSNRLGVILTFAVYKTDLPPNAPPNERIQSTDGYMHLTLAELTGFIAHISGPKEVVKDCDQVRGRRRRVSRNSGKRYAKPAAVGFYVQGIDGTVAAIKIKDGYFAGMLDMLMDTKLDVTQQDYVRTAHASGKALVSLINEVLDQAKIESGKLELEAVRFDLRAILDDVLSLFSERRELR